MASLDPDMGIEAASVGDVVVGRTAFAADSRLALSADK
jgi:hypothetical protein